MDFIIQSVKQQKSENLQICKSANSQIHESTIPMDSNITQQALAVANATVNETAQTITNLSSAVKIANYFDSNFNLARNKLSVYQDYLLYDLEVIWSRIPIPPLYVTYFIITSLAVSIVVVASLATVRKPVSAEKPDKLSPLYHPADDLKIGGFEGENVGESEAYLMPVIGGITLVSIYMAFKYLTVDYIQLAFSLYFAAVSMGSMTNVISMALKYVARVWFSTTLPHFRLTVSGDSEYHSPGMELGETYIDKVETEERQKKKEKLIQKGKTDAVEKMELEDKIKTEVDELFPRDKTPSDVFSITQYSNYYFSIGELIGLPIAFLTVALQYVSRHWIFGNILGASVAVQGVSTIRLDSFKTGFIMLLGLFLYDIFFVFGTDVMMTVATRLDVPVKLEVPRPSVMTEDGAQMMRATAMLGLGDIVVPALFLSLCLRFDLYSYYKRHQGLSYHLARPYSKPYFTAGMVAYTLGLVVTIIVMHVFKAGQPALLYLCPAIAGSTFIVGYLRGELSMLYEFRDLDDEKVKTEAAQKKKEELEKQYGEKTKPLETEKVEETSLLLVEEDDDSILEIEKSTVTTTTTTTIDMVGNKD